MLVNVNPLVFRWCIESDASFLLGNLPGWELSRMGIVQGGHCPGWELSG